MNKIPYNAMKKTALVTALASMLTSAVAYAAPGDYFTDNNGQEKTKIAAEELQNDSVVDQLINQYANNYNIYQEIDGGQVINYRTYRQNVMAEIVKALQDGTLTTNEIITSITTGQSSSLVQNFDFDSYTEQNQNFRVEAITSIGKTKIIVKLDKEPNETLTKDFFKVTGATVTDAKVGSLPNVYELTIDSLDGKKGTVTVNGISKEYTFEAIIVDKATVEKVEFNNYRHLTVTYNSVVDKASAESASNYYFEIVEGDAEYKAADLGDSNQLSKIGTDYVGTLGWWKDGHIVATEEGGKTVVNIYLPEDARFTNVKDEESVTDKERTLLVNLADTNTKALVKDTVVNIAVRNVKDTNGDRTLDTYVGQFRVLDETAPTFENAYTEKIDLVTGLPVLEKFSVDQTVTLTKGVNDTIKFEFNEPVFNAHELKSNNADDRDVKVYVNGKLKASTKDNDLAGILDFEMTETKGYDAARYATLDVAAAVAAKGDVYASGNIYNIKVVGITDLAGNIQVPSTITFNAKVQDPEVTPPTPDQPDAKPVVVDVKQVADNIFRVEFDQANATGQFIIENADGEDGRIKKNLPLSKEYVVDGEKKFYSYAVVKAVDVDAVDTVAAEDELLAYDNQDYINRVIKVEHPWTVKAGKFNVKGDNKNFGTVKIEKDIYAPEALQPEALDFDVPTNKTQIEECQIVIDVKDVVPQNVIDDYNNPVTALKYKYAAGDFDNNTVDSTGDYLPIKVSYVDDKGATHSALISNKAVPDNALPTGITIIGQAGISYADGKLTIDLLDDANNGWMTLLEKDSNSTKGYRLVDDVDYKVEIPKGYFADPAQDKNFTDFDEDGSIELFNGVAPSKDLSDQDLATVAKDADLNTGVPAPEKFDVLYVADGRTTHGYTSKAETITLTVKEQPEDQKPVDEIEDAVPQTSKELIEYDADKNELWVEFTGAIKLSTLKNPDNYTLNGKTLAQWGLTSDDIAYHVKNDADGKVTNKYAVFTVPTNSVEVDGDVAFEVKGVTNEQEGMMAPVSTQVALLDNTCPVAIEAKLMGQRQLLLTFDEPVAYREGANKTAAAKNFKVMIGDTQSTVLEAVVEDGERTVTLNLGTDITDTGVITVQVMENESGNILIIDTAKNKNPLNSEKVYTVDRN